MSEPQVGDPSTVMQSLKQRFAQRLVRRRRSTKRDPQSWLRNPEPASVRQPRFYDFNVWTEHKRVEKLRYMHRNPVRRGLVQPHTLAGSYCRIQKFLVKRAKSPLFS